MCYHLGAHAPPGTPNLNGAKSKRNGAKYIRTIDEQREIHIRFHMENCDHLPKGRLPKSLSARDLSKDVCVFCEQEKMAAAENAFKNSQRMNVAAAATESQSQNKHGGVGGGSRVVTFENDSSETSSTRRHIVIDLPDVGSDGRESSAAAAAAITGTGNSSNETGTNANGSDVPDVIVRSPSPTKQHFMVRKEKERPAGHLIKTFKQNELREKEVRNLLEDVKELNSFTESLTVDEWAS